MDNSGFTDLQRRLGEATAKVATRLYLEKQALLDEIEQLKQRNERLSVGLRQYADRSNWMYSYDNDRNLMIGIWMGDKRMPPWGLAVWTLLPEDTEGE